MTDEKKSSPSVKNPATKSLSRRTEESLEAVIGQLENNSPANLSDATVAKYFDTQQKMHKHMREDHKDHMEVVKHGRKYLLRNIIAIGSVLVVIIGIIAYTNKESLDKFIELFFAFLGGTGAGSAGTYFLRNRDG